MVTNGQMRIVNMLKKIGNIKKEKYMDMNTSNGTVDYLSPPKAGKDQWFMPVVLDNGTKIKFYCKFDPETSVGAKVRVHYGPERNGNATAFKVEKADVDINADVSTPTVSTPVATTQPTEKEIGMIAVGLAGRLSELFCTLHHDKGVQFKDTADEIAKWIGHGITGYEKAMETRKKLQSMKDENKTWDELDEKPF
jgi:hypothetical protein